MGRTHTILDLVRGLYDAVLDPDGWEGGFAAITAAVRGDHGLITVRDFERDAVDVVGKVGVDPLALSRLIDMTDSGALPAFMRCVPAGTAVSSQMLVRDRELELTDYYNDVLRPDGVFYKI